MATRTFLDACVLIEAHHGKPELREPALAILNDSSRLFIASPFLRLEIMPKSVYNRQHAHEAEFYRRYFDENVLIWISDVESIVRIAIEESERSGLAAMDALHIAAAYLGEADVLYTLERKTRNMHRTKLVTVVSLSAGERFS